jgi:hypothetical protein
MIAPMTAYGAEQPRAAKIAVGLDALLTSLGVSYGRIGAVPPGCLLRQSPSPEG